MTQKTPLILLPGLLTDAALWRHQTESLSDIAETTVADLTIEDQFGPMASRILARAPETFALAGLSMGGGHTINIAFSRPEMFRYVVLMSPAANARVETVYASRLKDSAALNTQFKLLWLGVGKADGLTGPGDRAFAETLTRHGVKHEFKLTEGRHEWTVWRHYLNDVAPLLFK